VSVASTLGEDSARVAASLVILDPAADGLRAPVVVACSGGADSLGLLVLAADAGLEPIAVHVDHGLRADSAADAEVVAAAADALGVEWRSVRVTIDVGGNLEARARDARYRALHDARAELGATAILVAHTADDQAETVLLNLLRGSGSAGLAGMARRRGAIVRPLLHLRRVDVRAVVEARGLGVVDDPTNADQRWRRAWIRHEVLPMLERGADRDVVPILVRQSEVLRAESDLLDDLGDQLLAEARTTDELEADSGLRAQVLIDASLPIARRAVRRWLGSPPPSADEVERVLAVARGECVATELAAGRRVQRSGGRLSFSRAQEVP
jgi:tRNA(Ile)-lysidine synthetase, N-terminal domain